MIAITLGLDHADPMLFAVLRVVTTAVVLAPIAWTQQRRARRPLDARFHRWALTIGLFQVATFFIAQNLGLSETGASLGAVLLYTQPFLVAIVARARLHERLTTRQVVGMALGWCGVAVLMAGEASSGTTPLWAMLCLLLAAMAWTAGTILIKSMPPIPLLPLLFWMNVYAIPPMLPFVLATGGQARWGMPLVAATLYASIFAGITGMGLSFVLLRRGAASIVSSWSFVVPVLTAALSVPVLGERMSPRLVVAGSATILGVALVNWSSGHINGR